MGEECHWGITFGLRNWHFLLTWDSWSYYTREVWLLLYHHRFFFTAGRMLDL